MASKTPSSALQELDALVTNASALLTQLEATLTSLSKKTRQAAARKPASATDVDPLKLAHDSASLIKAHTTKLSLLIVTEPFTPSAICKVLRELISGPAPALAVAAEACDPARYTLDYSQELLSRCHMALRDLRAFILKIPTDGNVLSAGEQRASADGTGKGSMAMTGVLWSVCDNIVRFAEDGVPAFYIKKVEETRLMLQDIMEELKEWGEEEDDDDDDDFAGEADRADLDSAVDVNDSGLNEPTSQEGAAQALLDQLMNSSKAIPRDDTNGIRDRLETCTRRLRLSMILCQAVTKRRLKTAPALPTADGRAVEILESMARELKRLPDQFEDAAMGFYDLDVAAIDSSMDVCSATAVGVAKGLSVSWGGSADEFTEWAEKFEAQMTK
jgi:hypothetical protein